MKIEEIQVFVERNYYKPDQILRHNNINEALQFINHSCGLI